MRTLFSLIAIALAALLFWAAVGNTDTIASDALEDDGISKEAPGQERASSPASEAATAFSALVEPASTVSGPDTEAIKVSPPQQQAPQDSLRPADSSTQPQPALFAGTESQAALLQARRSAELHLRFPLVPTLSDSTATPVSAPPVATPHR